MNLTERNKMIDKICIIAMMCIFVEFFLYAVDTCFTTRIDLMLAIPSALNVIGLIFLAISVFLFVKFYNKNDDGNLIYAIEFLVLAILCPFLTYWYYPKYFGLTVNWVHEINKHALWILVFAYYAIRVGYVVYKSYNKTKNNATQKLNKKKAKN